MIGIGAVHGFGLVLGAEDEGVEIPLLADVGVAGGVEGVLGVEFGLLRGAQGVVGAGDFVEAEFGFEGAPVGDDLDGEEGVDVFLNALGGEPLFAGSRHGCLLRGVDVCQCHK